MPTVAQDSVLEPVLAYLDTLVTHIWRVDLNVYSTMTVHPIVLVLTTNVLTHVLELVELMLFVTPIDISLSVHAFKAIQEMLPHSAH